MVSRFIQELLNSTIDLRLSNIIETEDGNQLRVVMKHGGIKAFLGGFFFFFALILIIAGFSSHSFIGWLLTLIFFPTLLGLSCLFVLGILEKTFNREERLLIKKFRIFKFIRSESVPLPKVGTINLSSALSAGGQKTPGGAMRYSVSIPQCPGSSFSTFHDYHLAKEFASKIAAFLSYEINDTVEQEYRRDMRYSSFR